MKSIIYILILFIANLPYINAQTEKFTMHGSPVLFEYAPTALEMRSWNTEEDRVVLHVWTDILDRHKTYKLDFRDNSYQITLTFADTSIKMILFAIQRTDSDGRRYPMQGQEKKGENFNPWDILFIGNNGSPVQGACLAKAISYMSHSKARSANLDLAEKAVEMELSLYPENLAARRIKYALLLKQHGADNKIIQAIRNDIHYVLNEMPEQKETLFFAYGSYHMIGDQNRAREAEKRLIEIDPQGNQAARQRFGEIMNLSDLEQKAEEIEAFLADYENTPFFESALAQLATTAIQLEDTTRMIKTGQTLMQHASSPVSANGLAGLAGVFAESEFRLDLGLSFIQKALDLIDVASQFPAPMGLNDDQWKEELNLTEARFRDIYGLLLLKTDNVNEAVKELEKAVKVTSQPGIYYNYGLALQKQYNYEEAFIQYARGAAFEGYIGDESFHALIDLWTQTGRDTLLINSYVQNAVTWIENRFKQRILEKRNIRPAPNFELEDIIRGNWVSLSDQEGTVVVLCFWATWSSASEQLLEELVNVAHLYGNQVLFLTIATDTDWQEVDQYVRRNRIIFPVLINDETDQEYGLLGVPMVYVIDHQNRIHFEHRGYSPDMIQVLSVQLDDLLSNLNN